jgi:hypothetical protein
MATAPPSYPVDRQSLATAPPPYPIDRRLMATASPSYPIDRRLMATASPPYPICRRLMATACSSSLIDRRCQPPREPAHPSGWRERLPVRGDKSNGSSASLRPWLCERSGAVLPNAGKTVDGYFGSLSVRSHRAAEKGIVSCHRRGFPVERSGNFTPSSRPRTSSTDITQFACRSARSGGAPPKTCKFKCPPERTRERARPGRGLPCLFW